MKNFVIKNVKVVTPGEVISSGGVVVENGLIYEVFEGKEPSNRGKVINGKGRWLFPGFIDLHNDSLEKELQPRPRAVFPLELALYSFGAKLSAHGITRIFHSLSLMEGRQGLADIEQIRKVFCGIKELGKHEPLGHYIHARYDIMESHFHDILVEFIGRHIVDLLSFMEHNPERRDRGLDTAKYINSLSFYARENEIPMASHDDYSRKRVVAMEKLGVRISEFPRNLETAEYSASRGMFNMIGAPNVIMGRSSSGNLSGIEAIKAGVAHIICSDYMAAGLLYALLILIREHHIFPPEAVNMVSLNPARAAGLDRMTGSIEKGKQADLTLVKEQGRAGKVDMVFFEGRLALLKEQHLLTDIPDW